MSVSMGASVNARIGSRIALAVAACAVGVSAWMAIDRRPVAAGWLAAGAGTLLLAVAATGRSRPDLIVERTLDSFVDRAFDGAVLGAVAWADRIAEPWIAAGALAALGSSFLAAYIRARGAALGYGVDESLATRALRYGLASIGLITGGTGWSLWSLAAVMSLSALVRASQVAKEERL